MIIGGPRLATFVAHVTLAAAAVLPRQVPAHKTCPEYRDARQDRSSAVPRVAYLSIFELGDIVNKELWMMLFVNELLPPRILLSCQRVHNLFNT
jgi:hypothetical protein